jgi:pyrroloquinoline quinone biosynthesis protein B
MSKLKKLSNVMILVILCLPITVTSKENVSLVVLGVAQDAGYPQINCYKSHCTPAWKDPTKRRLVTSLAVIDRGTKQKFLFDATPDIKQQMYRLHLLAPDEDYSLSGVLLTHGHMGHYTGLMHFGREAMGAKGIKVYAMPRMAKYLSSNGPWSQLVELKNIQIKNIEDAQGFNLNSSIKIIPLLVPHRDEYTETVGYKIIGPNKTALFIPDIDKWKKWSSSIVKMIKEVDYAFLDATFYSNGELPSRDMSEVPHPFVEESMQLFTQLKKADKNKVIFIHFNHSNPLLIDGSEAQKEVVIKGFRFAVEGMKLAL